MACDFPRVANANPYVFAATIGADFGNHQPTYVEIISTSEVMTGILMIFLMFIAYVLAAGSFRNNLVRLPWPFHRLTGFNAFWYSHHLFILVYALLIIHSIFLFLTHDWLQKTVSISPQFVNTIQLIATSNIYMVSHFNIQVVSCYIYQSHHLLLTCSLSLSLTFNNIVTNKNLYQLTTYQCICSMA